MPDEGVEGHFKALLSSTSHGPPRPCPPSPSVPVPPTLPVEPQPLCSLCLRAWEAIGGWRGLRGGRVTEHSVGPGAPRSGSGAWPGQIPAASGQSGAPRGPEATHVPRVRQGLPQDIAPDQAPAHAHGRALKQNKILQFTSRKAAGDPGRHSLNSRCSPQSSATLNADREYSVLEC